DIAVQPLLFPPAFWRVGPAVNQAYAQDRARAGKPRIGERRAVVAVVPTSAQLRLCRRRDYADPGAEGLLSGGGRAESIGIILSLAMILVPPISEGGADGKTGKQGHEGAGNRAAGPVRTRVEGRVAGARLYAAEHGDRDAAGGASEPLAGSQRPGRGRPDQRADGAVCVRAAGRGPHLGAVAAQRRSDLGDARRPGSSGPASPGGTGVRAGEA